MNLTVTGHHLDVTDSLRDYVSSKMDRLERHSDDVQDVHVILNCQPQRHSAVRRHHRIGYVCLHRPAYR